VITKIIWAGGYNIGDEIIFITSLTETIDEEHFVLVFDPDNVYKR
jgi:hypothetical protein